MDPAFQPVPDSPGNYQDVLLPASAGSAAPIHHSSQYMSSSVPEPCALHQEWRIHIFNFECQELKLTATAIHTQQNQQHKPEGHWVSP